MFVLALKALIGVSLVLVASLGLGSWLSRKLGSAFSQLDRLAFGLLAGFGILSLVLFLLGQFSFTRRTILTVMGLMIVTFAKSLLNLMRDSAVWVETCRKAPRVPVILILLILIVTATAGLGEITGDWNNDTVAYHLLGPKVWLRNGVIRPVSDNSHTAFPQTAETIYAALMAMGGPRAPALSSFLTFGMLLLIASSLAMRSGMDARGAWWVAALVATMPAVYSGSAGCFVDGIYAAFVLAAIRIGADAERKGDWAIFGMFCGLAMGTKYTGILAFPPLVLCAVWIRTRLGANSWRDNSRAIVVAASLVCVVAGPYYLRNWILLGCPIYPPPPGFAHVCSPKHLSPDVVAGFHAYIRQRGEGMGRGLWAFLMLPVNLTYHTSNFHGAGGIGLAPLALAPIGLVAFRRNPIVKMISVLGLLLLVAWFVTQQESRFLIHVYIIAVILAVLGWGHLWLSRQALSRWLAIAIIVTSVCYGTFMIGKSWPEKVGAVISSAYAQNERTKNIPFLESFMYLNKSSDVRRVLILDRSVTPFYLDKDYVKPVGQWGERTLPGGLSSLQVLENVRDLGISHVLDVNSEVGPFQIVGRRKGLTLVVDSQNQRVYRVD